MLTRKIVPLMAAFLLTTIATTASANVISFSPASQQAALGGQVSFDINMEFVSNTVGGSIDVFYDSGLLSFVSFEFDVGFLSSIADPDFAVMPDNCLTDGAAIGGCSLGDAELNGIGFGNFDGITGTHRIGMVTFDTLDVGYAVLTMATNDVPWGGFYSSVDASELLVLYAPAKVQIQAVPLPAAAWLLLSGIGLLGGLSRRKS